MSFGALSGICNRVSGEQNHARPKQALKWSAILAPFGAFAILQLSRTCIPKAAHRREKSKSWTLKYTPCRCVLLTVQCPRSICGHSMQVWKSVYNPEPLVLQHKLMNIYEIRGNVTAHTWPQIWDQLIKVKTKLLQLCPPPPPIKNKSPCWAALLLGEFLIRPMRYTWFLAISVIEVSRISQCIVM